MSKSKLVTRKSSKLPTTTVLDEETSAHVIAEYLAIEAVQEAELSVLDEARPLSRREIAIVFRVSEVLAIPAPFEMAPRFRLAFERARVLVTALGAGSVASEATA